MEENKIGKIWTNYPVKLKFRKNEFRRSVAHLHNCTNSSTQHQKWGKNNKIKSKHKHTNLQDTNKANIEHKSQPK